MLIEKVVFNLLSNAIKFTPSGGNIVFSLSKTILSALPVESQKELALPVKTEFVSLSVADSGKGISKEDMKNIFAPFYQGEDENKENVGTGIGLSLTRSIVQFQITVLREPFSKYIFLSVALLIIPMN